MVSNIPLMANIPLMVMINHLVMTNIVMENPLINGGINGKIIYKWAISW